MSRRRAVYAVALACTLAAFAAAAGAEVAERIVARVNRDVISLTEWEDMTNLAMSGNRSGKVDRAKVAAQVLDRMISDRLIIQAAIADGLKSTDSEVAPEVDREVDAVREGFKSQREFENQLRREGISLDDLRTRIAARIKDKYMYFKMLNRKRREFDTSLDVTEEEMAAYVRESGTKWMNPSEVRARHMQFNVDPDLKGAERAAALEEARKKAAAARAALKRGEAFEDVAKTLSEDPATRMNGGDLGTFSRGTYDEVIEKAAFSLKPGEVSEPVESKAGLHLVKAEEVLKPRPMGLDNTIKVEATQYPGAPLRPGAIEEMTLREYVRRILKNERVSRAMQDWVDGLKAVALIEKFAGPGPGR